MQIVEGPLSTISIHALREESDCRRRYVYGDQMEFQSTLSVRRATCGWRSCTWPESISIHALREESDSCSASVWQAHSISIHALREESDWTSE